MTLTINISPATEAILQERRGSHVPLAESAKIDLAMSWYQQELLNLEQVGTFLEMSVEEVLGLMKQRGIPMYYSIEDLEQDRKTLRKLFDR